MNAIRRLCHFSFVVMTAFFLTVVLVFNLKADATICPPLKTIIEMLKSPDEMQRLDAKGMLGYDRIRRQWYGKYNHVSLTISRPGTKAIVKNIPNNFAYIRLLDADKKHIDTIHFQRENKGMSILYVSHQNIRQEILDKMLYFDVFLF